MKSRREARLILRVAGLPRRKMGSGVYMRVVLSVPAGGARALWIFDKMDLFTVNQ